MKRRLRRIVSWLCVLTLCLGLLPTTALAATAEGNDSLVTLEYENDGNDLGLDNNSHTVKVTTYVDNKYHDEFSVEDAYTYLNEMSIEVKSDADYDISSVDFNRTVTQDQISADLKSYTFVHSWSDSLVDTEALEISVYLRTPLPKPNVPNGVYEGNGDVVFNLYQDQLLKMLYIVTNNDDIDPDEIEDVTLHFTKNVGAAIQDSYEFYWADPTADYLGHYHISGRTYNTYGDVIPYNIKSITLTYNSDAVTIPADKLSCILTSDVGRGVYEIKANDSTCCAVAFYDSGDSGIGNAGIFKLHDIVFVEPGETVTQMPQDPEDYIEYQFAGWSTKKSGGDPFNESYVVESDMRVWAQKYSSDYSSSLIYVDNTGNAFLDRFVELCNATYSTSITVADIRDSVKIQVNGSQNGEHTNPNYYQSPTEGNGWDTYYGEYTAYKIYNFDNPNGDPDSQLYNTHIPFDEIQSITIFADVTLNGNSVTVSFVIDKGNEPGEFGAVVDGYKYGTGSIDGVFWLKMN